MNRGRQLRVAGMALILVSLVWGMGGWIPSAQAQRQARVFEQEVTSGSGFNEYRGYGEPIEWTHSLGSDDLAAANSGGVIVDAYDVDYPADDEHDRLFINGNDYGLLEGRNNSWQTSEKSIDLNDLHSGSNNFRVDPNELNGNWRLTIRRSTLFLYADEDFELDATPNSRSVDTTDETTYDVTIDWIGAWDNPVDLSVSGLPSGATAEFSPASVTEDGGQSTLTVTLVDVAPGSYPLTITGSGTANYEDDDGSRSVTVREEVDLLVGGATPEDGMIRIDPDEIAVDRGETVSSTVSGDFAECDGSISIEIVDSRNVRDATGSSQFERIYEPEKIVARLLRTELTPGNPEATLEMRVGEDMESGEYEVAVEGNGCGIDGQQVSVLLKVKTADLKITKSQSQSTLMPNMVQIYTLRIQNRGGAAITDVTVTDELDNRLTYVDDTADGASHSEENGVHIWEFDKPLQPDEVIRFNINARVDPFIRAGESIFNQAEADGDQLDEPVESNTVTAVAGFAPVEPDGLRVTKRAMNRNARIGGILTYRIEVENISQAGPILDIDLTDRMPNGIKIPDSKTARDGALFDDPQRSGRVYTWQLGNLGPGERTVITYQAVVGTNAASGRNENIAEARGVDGGGNQVSGEDSALVMLGAGDLEILGQITVTAYLDGNRNELLDGADEPLQGLEVLLIPPGMKQATDEEGETLFAELKSGQYLVAVNELRLAEDMFVSGETSQLVRLMEGESADVPFLLFKDPGYGKLVIRAFSDRNRNSAFDDGDTLIPSFRAVLKGKARATGKKGRAIFSRLEPGSYELAITAGGKTYSQPLEIKGGLNEVDIPISASRLKINLRQSAN